MDRPVRRQRIRYHTDRAYVAAGVACRRAEFEPHACAVNVVLPFGSEPLGVIRIGGRISYAA